MTKQHTIPTEWLAHWARARPEHVAVADASGRSHTYAELYASAAVAARCLSNAAAGGLCLIELGPGIEHAIAMHASILAGVPFQTLRPDLPGPERRAALDDAPGFVRFDPAWIGRPAPGPPVEGFPAPEPGDILSRVATSGTSGRRRPVDLSFANHYASATASAFNLGLDSTDRWLCCLPVDHVGGLNILIRSAIYGSTAVVHDGFDPERVAAALERGEASIVSLVSRQLARLLEHDAPLERARAILIGGGPVSGALLDAAMERGANVVQTYGLTEACSQVCTLSVADARRKLGSAGRPLLGTEIELEGGEVLVSGPTVAAGSLDGDGWLRTGDFGSLDAEGFLYVEGRRDELIVTGGENVMPAEVEDALTAHPGVAEAAAFGREDREWGRAVTALVVLTQSGRAGRVGAEALREHCRERLAAFKVPKAIELVDELPRTDSGKLLRRELH